MKILVHRAGYKSTGFNSINLLGENSILAAKEAFAKEGVHGIEVDVSYSSDSVPFVTHKSISRIKYEDILNKYPNQKPLDEWVEWLKDNIIYHDKTILIHLKHSRHINSENSVRKLLKSLSELPNPLIIATTNICIIKDLVRMRRSGGYNYSTVLMFAEPLFPSFVFWRTKKYLGEDMDYLDGVNFFFIDSFLKEIVSFLFNRGDFITITDYLKYGVKDRVPIPNPFGLQDLYYLKTKRFVELAHENNLFVIAASTGSVNSLTKMKDMGCDYLMVNVLEDVDLIQG